MTRDGILLQVLKVTGLVFWEGRGAVCSNTDSTQRTRGKWWIASDFTAKRVGAGNHGHVIVMTCRQG